MKYFLLIFFFLLNSFAFAQLTFDKHAGNTTNNITASDVKQTYDLGYIVSGNSYLLKTNINGDTIWARYFYANVFSETTSVSQAFDSGYIYTEYNNLMKISSSGYPLWSKYYQGFSFNSQCQAPDSGYILVGITDSLGAGNNDIFLIKTDSAGNPTWAKTYGGTGDDYFFSLQATSDGGYIIAGSTTTFGAGAYLIKINSVGDTLWSKVFNAANFNSIQQTYDKGYIMTGGTGSRVCLTKVDSSGNLQWCKTYGDGVSPFEGDFVVQGNDSGYVISGQIALPANYSSDFLLIKTDKKGNVVWIKAWTSGSGVTITAETMRKTSDGGSIMAVSSYFRNYGSDFDLTKTDTSVNTCDSGGGYSVSIITDSVATTVMGAATIIHSFSPVATVDSVTTGNLGIYWSGCLENGIDVLPRKKEPITVSPNPVSPNGGITIFLNQDLNNADLTVFNVTGQPMYNERVSGKGQIVLEALKNKVSSGVYFIRIIQGSDMMVVKFVVM